MSGVNSRKTKPVLSTALPSNGESIAVTPEEVRSLLYSPHSEDWPAGDRDTECERILSGLEKIMELSIAEPFNYPVDLDQFPQYALLIGYPIDLNTIKERLENRYYRRLNALEWDIRKIEEDAHAFNESNSSIVRQSTLLTNLLIEFINDPDCSNPIPIYKRLCKNLEENEENAQNLNSKRSTRNKQKNEPTSANTSTNVPPLRFNLRSRQHTEENTKTEDIQAGSSFSASYSWREDCKKLIADIMRHPDSSPFRNPVDYNEYPDYLEKIENPIDFGMIRQRIFYNLYGNDLFLFDKDCTQVFINSKRYNTNLRSKVDFNFSFFFKY